MRNQMSGMVISGTATNALNKSRPVKVDDAKVRSLFRLPS